MLSTFIQQEMGGESLHTPGMSTMEGHEASGVYGETAPVVAVCSRDGTAAQHLVSTLRRRPCPDVFESTVLDDGPFVMFGWDAHVAGGKRRGACDIDEVAEQHYASFAEDMSGPRLWDDLNFEQSSPLDGQAHRVVASAACTLFVLGEDEPWDDAARRMVAKLRHDGPRVLIVRLQADAQEVTSDSLAEIAADAGVTVLDVLLPEQGQLHAGAGAPDVATVVGWMAKQSRELAIALAQALPHFRAQLAESQIRTFALSAAALGAEPVPLVDLPLLLVVQHQLLRRIASMYDKPAPPVFSHEGAGMLTLGLCTRYCAQQALKFVPLVGWLLSAILSGASTWLLGRALVLHYEGRPVPLIARVSHWLRAYGAVIQVRRVQLVQGVRERIVAKRFVRGARTGAASRDVAVTEIPIQGESVCPNGVDSSGI